MTYEERLRKLELIRPNETKLRVGIITAFTRLSPRSREHYSLFTVSAVDRARTNGLELQLKKKTKKNSAKNLKKHFLLEVN